MEEIKAGDIMLGNWFQVNGFLMYIDAIYSDMVSLDFKGNEGCSWGEYTKDLVPIPLTEDVLLKCGFEKKYEDDRYCRVFLIPNTKLIIRIVNYCNPRKSDFGFSLEIEDDTSWIELRRIHFIHQLQNLFFILSGNQLIINI